MKSLSSEEAQDLLRISRPTLYLWVRQGKLKPRRAGRGLMFDESEVMGLLGRRPHVAVWISRGELEEAKRIVRTWTRMGVRPSYLLEYLEVPSADFIRARVVSAGAGSEVRHSAPGGVEFDGLLESLGRKDLVFVSHEESVWRFHDVRSETSPAGDPYIVVELERHRGPGEGDERGRRIAETIGRMERGIGPGRVEKFSRGELYERDAR
jgi:excisionase family DNA binding protein